MKKLVFMVMIFFFGTMANAQAYNGKEIIKYSWD